MLVKLERPRLREEFFNYLKSHRSLIMALVSQNLLLQEHQRCVVADVTEWKSGDFNVCIPISISNWRSQRLIMRCPFPHMLDCHVNSSNSDSIDEKIRCEAATFAWISQNCTHVPIPRLWGFGLPSGLWVSKMVKYRDDCLLVLSLNLSLTCLGIQELLNTSRVYGPGFTGGLSGLPLFLVRRISL